MIGTTIEWYDFFLYGTAAALVFNKLFFPQADPLTGTMLAFTTYALGFAARPIGGIVFGHFGDRIGRKQLLMMSLMLMGGSTMLIGHPADLQRDRLAGPAGPGPAAARAGLRRRRRVGWRGADGHRVRRGEPPRFLGRLAAGGRAGGQPARRRRAGDHGRRADQGGFHRLGLARALPAVGGARGRRLLGARELGGEPALPAGPGRTPARRQGAGARRASASGQGASPSGPGCGWRRTSASTSSPPSA